MRKIFPVLLLMVIACADKKAVATKKYYDLDAIIATQVKLLSKGSFMLRKEISLDGKSDQTTSTPDSLVWAKELELFSELDAINKSRFGNAYDVTKGKDTNSNLEVLSLQSNGSIEVPVPMIKFFYLNGDQDLRKIEAEYLEDNELYTNSRILVANFDDVNGQKLLHHYRIEGFQKMVMKDSVRFSIEGEVSAKD